MEYINFSVAFRARAKGKITKPIYAMVIRDTKGQQIYGQNTYFAKISTDDLEVGSEIKVTFRQCLNLGSGDYLISLGLTRFENDQLQVIHRRYDAVKIKVVNYDGSIGLANCFSSINLNLVSRKYYLILHINLAIRIRKCLPIQIKKVHLSRH